MITLIIAKKKKKKMDDILKINKYLEESSLLIKMLNK